MYIYFYQSETFGAYVEADGIGEEYSNIDL